jgi:hypothetical protein
MNVVAEDRKASGMNNIFLTGDVHGEWHKLKQILHKNKGITISLGDIGIGFIEKKYNPLWHLDFDAPRYLEGISDFRHNPKRYFWIRGNHDNPDICKIHPNYLGDYGIYKDIFFVSGAFSIDKEVRTEGEDWWPDEELSIEDGYKLLDLYSTTKPEIVISHDCPYFITKTLYSSTRSTRTGQLLDAMYNTWMPSKWIFAHHHISWSKQFSKTKFRCLNILENIQI